jgi:5'-3' exonuclease
MTGKYTLVIDGNFFLHKTFFIGQKIKRGKPFNFIDEPEQDKNLLLWKLSVDFAAEIKRFEGVTHRIVYAIDSNSWRKTYGPDSDYKANRVKSSDIDWSKIYEVHNEFIAALENMGVIISRVKGAEADDLIFAWTSYLNQIGQNAIIVSGDNDLLQLVNRDKSSSANTVYYNKFDKDLHVFPGFDEWLNTDEVVSDIFNMPVDLMTNTKHHLKEIIKNNKMNLDEVNINDFIFKKIILGDKGDNVSPLDVKYKQGKNGTRCFVVTENQVNQIINEFKADKAFVNQSHLFTDEYIDQICEISKRVIKIDKSISDIRTKWELNRDLVYLHKKCIPEQVISDMFTQIESKPILSFSAIELHSLMNKDEILNHTTYSKEKTDSFSDSSIFQASMPKVSPAINKEVKITSSPVDSGFDDSFWKDLLK